MFNSNFNVQVQRKIEDLAFTGKLTRGIKFQTDLKLSQEIGKLERKLRQKQFEDGCVKTRFRELIERYECETDEEAYKAMSSIFIYKHGKVYHKKRLPNTPITAQTRNTFMAAMKV